MVVDCKVGGFGDTFVIHVHEVTAQERGNHAAYAKGNEGETDLKVVECVDRGKQTGQTRRNAIVRRVDEGVNQEEYASSFSRMMAIVLRGLGQRRRCWRWSCVSNVFSPWS